jgi:indolepyruvate ferredoxin oxidoreductase alpha subunit
MTWPERMFLSGNEAVAQAARDAGVALGAGYPGTPATEILEHFSQLGGQAEWAPNEKVALEVALGAAFGGASALVAMKHVGLNVAADPLFTAAYTGVSGALVVVSADDPGMASSQNEQDNRRYAPAAGVPMLEPADARESYDYALAALELSRLWGIPVLLRLTTRVCHSKGVLMRPRPEPEKWAWRPSFQRDVQGRVMIPAYARLAHRRLREKLEQIAALNEGTLLPPDAEAGARERLSLHHGELIRFREGSEELAIITSGVCYLHACEADPEAAIMKIGMTYPLPVERIRQFAGVYRRVVVIEEGDPYLADSVRAAGIPVQDKPAMYRFGELNVQRVRRILTGDTSPEPAAPAGKPPQLCQGCPHRQVFQTLSALDCIVAGDIGCYTLGVLPPYQAMDSCVCMGASIGVGLGLRHVLPDDQARRVVSVIGDSTFVHSGISGLVEMIYNPPRTGHVLLILDNGTTAMTGLQEHPGTGRTLDRKPTGRVVFEDLARTLGVPNVHVVDPTREPEGFRRLLSESLSNGQLNVIIARRPCLLAAAAIRLLSEGKQPK